jgi:hypothetical protein
MKALDIVRTPKGAIGFITETNNNGQKASIRFIGDTNKGGEHNAWWRIEQLEVIDSIPKMIATAMCHPFGQGHKDVLSNFKI